MLIEPISFDKTEIVAPNWYLSFCSELLFSVMTITFNQEIKLQSCQGQATF